MIFRIAGAALCMSLYLSTAGFSEDAEKTLVVADNTELTSFDQYYNNQRIGVIISNHIFDRLIYRDPKTNEMLPMLATSWEWKDDLTLVLKLREGVKFHDGEAFDADDVVYTITQALDPKNPVLQRNNVAWIKEVTKLDDMTVQMSLHQPFPAALHYLSGPVPIYGKDYYEKVGPDGMNAKPIGSGPYKVGDFELGSYVDLVRNENYWEGGPRSKPAIGNIKIRTILDINAQIAELVTGGIDWAWRLSNDQAQSLASIPELKLVPGQTMRVTFLDMDSAGRSGDHPLKNVLVRRAISHAIDRDTIRSSFMPAGGEVLNAFCYPMQTGCSQDVEVFDFNPEKAKALLAEAGLADGFSVALTAATIDRDISEAIAADLRRVGIQAQVQLAPYAATRDSLRAGKVTMLYSSWGSFSINDVSAITSVMFNMTGDDIHRDQQVHDLTREGDGILDAERREEAYRQALQRIASEALILPMWSGSVNYVFNSELDFTPFADEIPRFDLARWK